MALHSLEYKPHKSITFIKIFLLDVLHNNYGQDGLTKKQGYDGYNLFYHYLFSRAILHPNDVNTPA